MILHNSSHSCSRKAAHEFALEQTITGTFTKHKNPATPPNKTKRKNQTHTTKKKPHPQTFKILQQQKERKNNFTTYLHHLFTLRALKLNKYGFRKNDINKNKSHNYAVSSVPFQSVLKKINNNKDLVRLELKAGTAEHKNPPKNCETDNSYPAESL